MDRQEAEAVRPVRSRLEKLGIGPQTRVSVIGVDDDPFMQELSAVTPHVSAGRLRKPASVVVYGVRELRDLDRLTTLRAAVFPDGAIWVVWTKGRKALTEDHVRRAAIAQGLMDVKVISFSDELSGLKLVVPRDQRTKA